MTTAQARWRCWRWLKHSRALAGPAPYNKPGYKPQDWNELVVVAKDGAALCTCNGEVLEAAFKLPETGPIGLEGDRGQMEYRRIRIQEQ